jgi:dienelactone hydrolase
MVWRQLGINAGYPAYEAALKAVGVNYQIHRYPETPHGFHNDSTPRRDKAAAELSWEADTRAFQDAPELNPPLPAAPGSGRSSRW